MRAEREKKTTQHEHEAQRGGQRKKKVHATYQNKSNDGNVLNYEKYEWTDCLLRSSKTLGARWNHMRNIIMVSGFHFIQLLSDSSGCHSFDSRSVPIWPALVLTLACVLLCVQFAVKWNEDYPDPNERTNEFSRINSHSAFVSFASIKIQIDMDSKRIYAHTKTFKMVVVVQQKQHAIHHSNEPWLFINQITTKKQRARD